MNLIKIVNKMNREEFEKALAELDIKWTTEHEPRSDSDDTTETYFDENMKWLGKVADNDSNIVTPNCMKLIKIQRNIQSKR